MSSKPTQQYRMMLNTIEQAGYAKFKFQIDSSGPPAAPQWRAVVNVPVGTACEAVGGTKSAARDAACEQMLALFATHGVNPTRGQ